MCRGCENSPHEAFVSSSIPSYLQCGYHITRYRGTNLRGRQVRFGHQFIETEKYDAKPTYKNLLGYSPGVAVIGDVIVGIENRDGNTNVRFNRKEALERIFSGGVGSGMLLVPVWVAVHARKRLSEWWSVQRAHVIENVKTLSYKNASPPLSGRLDLVQDVIL